MINFCATQGPSVFKCLNCETIYIRGWYTFCPKCYSGAFQSEEVIDPHKYAKLKDGIWVLKEDNK